MRSGFETCLRDLCDTDSGTDVHRARQRSGICADRYGRSHRPYLGVGPGIELPTRMHYFEGALNGSGLTHGTPGRGLRRVPVVNFESFRAGGNSSNGILPRIFTSEFEQHLFDDHPLPFNGCDARHIPNNFLYIAAGSSEERPGQSSICSRDAVSSEQVAIRTRTESSNEQFCRQRETCLASLSPGREFQAIEIASSQPGGPALSEDGLNCTPGETTHGHGAISGQTIRAEGGEASWDDAQSTSSGALDRTIVYTPRSSSSGSAYGDPADGDLDNADVEDYVHFEHIRA